LQKKKNKIYRQRLFGHWDIWLFGRLIWRVEEDSGELGCLRDGGIEFFSVIAICLNPHILTPGIFLALQTDNLSFRFADQLLVVLVIYETDLSGSTAWTSLQGELNRISQPVDILVYDNSAESRMPPVSRFGKVHYRHDPSNPGVSKAYNFGLQLALAQKKSWLLLLDQDTTLPPHLFEVYQLAMEKNPEVGIFAPLVRDSRGLVSPFRYYFGKGLRLTTVSSGFHSFQHRRIINSGMLVSVKLFQAAGGYDERFPMDFSDICFTERVMAHSPVFYVVPVICLHELSSEQNTPERLETVAQRFKLFCLAARLYHKEISGKIIPMAILLPRALKLSWIYRDIRFLKKAFEKKPL
jgi:rhamnosyltransferase